MSSNDNQTLKIPVRYIRTISTVPHTEYSTVEYRRLDSNGETIRAYGNDLPRVAATATLWGKMGASRKTGAPLFFVEMAVTELPHTAPEIVDYIVSAEVGIEREKAEKMLELAGSTETFWDWLDLDPAQFDFCGVSSCSLAQLEVKVRKTRFKEETFRYLGQSLTITPQRYKTIYRYFQGSTQRMLQEPMANPFCLAGCGFNFDELDFFCSRTTRIPINHFNRLTAAITNVLLSGKDRSHSGLPREDIIPPVLKMLEKNGTVPETDIQECLDSAVANKLYEYRNGLYYLPRSNEEEQYIADRLFSMAQRPQENISEKVFQDTILEYERIQSEKIGKAFKLSENQIESVKTALTRSVCVITGGPGTGKSTVLDALLYCWKHFFDRNWLLMAPSGKAATRMTETTGQLASTIHSAFGLDVSDRDVRHMEIPPVQDEHSLIVIDECSMIDQSVMASILAGLAPAEGQPQHLILVGDPCQLPSVSWGNVLADVIESGIIPVAKLETIYRQSSENPIPGNSMRINAGITELDWSNNLFKNYSTKDFFHSAKMLEMLYRGYVNMVGIEDVICLSPYREKADIGTHDLNIRFQAILNPPTGHTPELAFSSITFRPKDRVLQRVNTDRVRNGDTGTVKWVKPSAIGADPCISVQFDSGVTVKYSKEEAKQLDLAYAMTIHKSQGSQWKVVLMVLPFESSDFLRRNLLYTAVTRSSHVVALVGPPDTITDCIQNDKKDDRHTNLAWRLRNKAQAYAYA